ncbi:MAG: hypothetical protein C4562_06495 [Actinobacteria bacterium]|nr:MAG: hypothetical protein C4562_06495 [Actinomycetota bacterium]
MAKLCSIPTRFPTQVLRVVGEKPFSEKPVGLNPRPGWLDSLPGGLTNDGVTALRAIGQVLDVCIVHVDGRCIEVQVKPSNYTVNLAVVLAETVPLY